MVNRKNFSESKNVRNENVQFNFKYYAILVVTVSLVVRDGILGDDVSAQYKSDTGIPLVDLVAKYGYPFENHTAQTEDGYILTIHRIPFGTREKNDTTKTRPAVLLIGGLCCDSSPWLVMGPNKSLGYILADHGYDVWLGNARGSKYSRKHVSLNPDKGAAFWKFSFNEMGIYDLPAMIDYILKTTGQKQINYIGHSLGAMIHFVLLSERPEYDSKMNLGFAFAPTTHLKHSKNPYLPLIAGNLRNIKSVFNGMRTYEVCTRRNRLPNIFRRVCEYNTTDSICPQILFLTAGPDTKQFDMSLFPLITTHLPAGTSARQIYHFLQGYNAGGKFQKYDFGKKKNLKIYGTPTPPQYNMSKIKAPNVLYSASLDWLADPVDVRQLSKDLGNTVGLYNIKQFNHIDFIWGKDAHIKVYAGVLDMLKKYN